MWASHPILDFGCFNCRQFDSYVQRVDNIVRQYNGPKLQKFRIVYPVSGVMGPYIDGWISFALRNGASEIELDFRQSPNKYYVPTNVFSLPITSPNYLKNFESVSILCLRNVNLTDESFDQILCSCVSLESFLIHSCRLVNAKNTAPHMKLKSLELYYCGSLEKLELLAPNLISFKYQGLERTLCIKDAQDIASLRLLTLIDPASDTSLNPPRGKDFIFSQFSYLHKLEHLHLSLLLIEDLNDFTDLCAFSNLKHLMLDDRQSKRDGLCYKVAAFFLGVSPYLEQLEIYVEPYYHYRYRKIKALELASTSPHQNLKEVKMFGFRGCANTMEFLAYLLRHAVSLEKIDVTAGHASWFGDRLIVDTLSLKYLKADDAKMCMESVFQLRQTLHQNVQFIFRDYEQCIERIDDDVGFCFCHQQSP